MSKTVLVLAVITVLCVSYAVYTYVPPIINSPTSDIVFSGDINLNSTEVIATNKLQFGFQLDFGNGHWFALNPTRMQLSRDCNFKLIRMFDYYMGWNATTQNWCHPCTSWNEATKNGTFDWTNVDSVVGAIFSVGAEPLIALGMYDMDLKYLPSGMVLNPATHLPYIDSWAEYCAYWVRHLPNVKYWEIVNEIDLTVDMNTKMLNYIQLFNTAFNKMKSINPNLSISFDRISFPSTIMNQAETIWLANGGANLDSINYHQYQCGWLVQEGGQYYYNDATLFSRAETDSNWIPNAILAKHAQDTWYNSRGVKLPIINSESNLNSHWDGGTDPRNVQISGAVWLGLTLRQEMLNGVSYHIHFTLAGNYNYETTKQPYGGYGFGMTDSVTDTPYFTYCVYKMLANNLSVNDKIVYTNTTNSNVRVISWDHYGKLNILLIHLSTTPETISFSPTTSFTYQKLDDPTNSNFRNAQIQSGTVDSSSITLNGYTVMLLQK